MMVYQELYDTLYKQIEDGVDTGVFDCINFTPPHVVQNYISNGVTLYKEGYGRDIPFEVLQTAKSLAAGNPASVKDIVSMMAWHGTEGSKVNWDDVEYMTSDEMVFRQANGWKDGGAWSVNVYNQMVQQSQAYIKQSQYLPKPIVKKSDTPQQQLNTIVRSYQDDYFKTKARRVDKVEKDNRKMGLSGSHYRSTIWPDYLFNVGDRSSYINKIAKNNIDVVSAINDVYNYAVEESKRRNVWSKRGEDQVSSNWSTYIQATIDRLNELHASDRVGTVNQYDGSFMIGESQASAELINKILVVYEKAYKNLWEHNYSVTFTRNG